MVVCGGVRCGGVLGWVVPGGGYGVSCVASDTGTGVYSWQFLTRNYMVPHYEGWSPQM